MLGHFCESCDASYCEMRTQDEWVESDGYQKTMEFICATGVACKPTSQHSQCCGDERRRKKEGDRGPQRDNRRAVQGVLSRARTQTLKEIAVAQFLILKRTHQVFRGFR